jgi:hypothetical protein
VPLKFIPGPQAFSPSLLSVLHEASRLSTMIFCLASDPSNGSSWPWTKTSEMVSQSKSFLLLNCFSQLFVTGTKKCD